ncbi:putative transporter [Bremerella sp.]|uniref:putative transporter n=1 Tax=Bremerella sp. TaxID=2795602 RepID=UPI00391A6F27
MNWLFQLYETNPPAQAFAVISLVCMGGMILGSLRLQGIGLGTSGVLFVGILVGNFSEPIDHHTLEFLKEFGLVLFVFTIGLQLGPGFFASMRQMGLRLNLLAVAIVATGAIMAIGMGWLMGLDSAAVLGLFAGGTTNTPSLGAAQQTLAGLSEITDEQLALPALAYAVSYPMAVVGIIGTILLLKTIYRIDAREESARFASEQQTQAIPLVQRTLVICNAQLDGKSIDSLRISPDNAVTISRIRKSGQSDVELAKGNTIVNQGDSILAVGTVDHLDKIEEFIGYASEEDLMTTPGRLTYHRVVITNSEVLGKTLGELALEQRFGVVATRLVRGDVELMAVDDLQTKFGDTLRLVGTEEDLNHVSQFLGNSVKALNETQFISFFAGIAFGIALGTMPIPVPGLPVPLRLSLAGGPLLVAILVGRLGKIGPLVWHIPLNANLAIRELGIALFFACVGLIAGPKFFDVVFSIRGVLWLVAGALITIVPLMLVGLFARQVLRMNFVSIAGLIAGSMTDPPALAFASGICQSEYPAVTYAAVYPLTMVLRIMTVQILAVLLLG